MAFVLPWTINKLVSTNINNANSVTGTYTSVSLKVNGKTELSAETTIASLGVGKNTSSSYAVDVLGKINASSDISSGGDITSTGSMSSSSSTLTPTTSSITVNNYNFATPAQSTNNFTTISSPYSAITGWSLSLVSGTAPAVFIGNGFTGLVNSFPVLYPEYPLFSQYLSFENGGQTSVFSVSQNLTFATTGSYLLTMFVWGEYNRYSTTQSVSVTCGNGSVSNFTTIEQGWSKLAMKFKITTAGTNLLTILINSSTVDSGITISGIQIVKQTGLTVSDGGNTNNQLVSPFGSYTAGTIYNTGTVYNYGALKNFGPLSLYLPYSSGSVVIGTSLYGSDNSADEGKYNVLIGQSNVVSASRLQTSKVDGCVAIGYAALEQGGALSVGGISRCVGIGYQANRWNNVNCDDNCAVGYQAGQGLGYGGSNSARNCSFGSYVLALGYGTCNDNAVFGYNSISAYNNSLGRSFNSVCGGSSLVNCFSNYNSCLGYGSAANILNTASNNNTFCGALVCTTQTGSTNVLSNCSFFGSASNVSVAGSYSNSTCLGYNSRITGNNQIILGTANETTFAMGGLTIPVSEILTILGTITANSLSITPTQLGYLNALTAGIVSLTGAQTIAGVKTFSSAPVMSGASITASTIPSTAINNTTFVALTGNQTIAGVKTFSSAPVMSGASITASTIPSTAINNTTFVTTSGAQTVGGIKTFSSPPVMDGTSIEINTIPLTSVQYTFRNTLYNYGYGENALGGIGVLADNNSGFGSAAVGGGGIGVSGSSNSGFGAASLYQIESGDFNTACGTATLYGVKTGSNNCSLGSTTAYTTDGDNNVFIGYNSGTNGFSTNITNDNCTLVGKNTYAPDTSSYRTVIGSDATADLGIVGDNSIVLGRDNTDSTYVMKDLYLRASMRLLPTGTEVTTSKLEWLAGVNSASNLSITNPKVIINTSELSYINTTGTTTLEIGNSTSVTKLNGALIVSNNSQKVNGYSTLAGSPNNLSKPLSEYYTLSSSSAGALTLPVIDADMYGSQVTFVKVSTAATWTINAGSGNTFRLYKSNSTATATSISMANNFTVLKIVATQATVWDVITTDIFYEAAANWVVGTRYFPMLMNPTNITASVNWNTTLPTAFYGIQGFAITAAATITLPLSTNVNVPDGLRIKFRRVVAGAFDLSVLPTSADKVMAYNAVATVTTTVILVPSGTNWGEIYLNKTTATWYCM